jgi:hypothetical protein
MNDWEHLHDWLKLLDEDRLSCLVDAAAVLAAVQIGVYVDPRDFSKCKLSLCPIETRDSVERCRWEPTVRANCS